MRPADLRLLYEYGYDRNVKLLDQAEKLTEEEFAGEPPFGHDSVRQVFIHLASAEHGWRGGWQTGERHNRLDPGDYPDIASIRALFDLNNAESLAFIDSLSEDDLDADDFIGVPLWQTMTHVFNHGTQHRSEIAMLLTHFGHSPGNLDLSILVRERAAERD
jgi:uncharacterized damage-inducible protein DinB